MKRIIRYVDDKNNTTIARYLGETSLIRYTIYDLV